jgi:hypothetical protein
MINALKTMGVRRASCWMFVIMGRWAVRVKVGCLRDIVVTKQATALSDSDAASELKTEKKPAEGSARLNGKSP